MYGNFSEKEAIYGSLGIAWKNCYPYLIYDIFWPQEHILAVYQIFNQGGNIFVLVDHSQIFGL